MKLFLSMLLIFWTTLVAGKINLAVAANLGYVMPELTRVFNQKYPDIQVISTVASSGILTAQIKQGARYDLFLSANMKYPNYLYEQNLALERPKLYAEGSLALFSPKKLNCHSDMHCLLRDEVKRIAVGNPKTAPYGKASIEAFKSAQLYKQIKPKLIYAESISQTLSYALTAADMGVIAKASLFAPKMKRYQKGEHWIEVDPTLYQSIKQGMVLLKRGRYPSEAQKFYHFLQMAEAKNIFRSFGYEL